METRGRVFRALLDGQAPPVIAAALGISRQAVLSHAKALIRGGVLEQISKPRAPLKVRAGVRAESFARAVEEETTERGGRAAWSAHHCAWRFDFTSGPAREVEGARESVANGKRQLSWTLESPAREVWTLCAHLGARRRSLVAHAPPIMVSAEDVPGFDEVRSREAEAVLRGAARRWGFALSGPLRRASGRTHFALVVPGLGKEGVSGVTPVWSDGTPAPGALETDRVGVVEAVAALPGFMARAAAVEEDLRAQLEVLLSNQEAAARVSRGLVRGA